MERSILHVDMNNFYASVECLERPEIRDLPVVVGGNEEARHGIVLAKNYVAKAYGIQTAETLRSARKKCPYLVIVPPRFDRYILFSKCAREIYEKYTDQVESFGLDENWLDVTGSYSLFGDGTSIANEIRERIKKELGVTVSVGVSFNKIFAKLGSDMKKPDATTVITREDFRQKVWPLPASDLLYVGPQTTKKLSSRNIKTIGDLANASQNLLIKAFGSNGLMLWNFANGNDSSPVHKSTASNEVKSIGNSTTTPKDLVTEDSIKTTLFVLSESVSARLREQNLKASTLQVLICENTFSSYERQRRLTYPCCDSNEIFRNAFELVMQNRSSVPIRKLGIRVTGLLDNTITQFSFLPEIHKIHRHEMLEDTIDNIRERYGHHSIFRGIMLVDKKLSHINPKDDHNVFPVSFAR